MILEVAILNIKSGEAEKFEKDFANAGKFIGAANGYRGHSLRKCVEEEDKYILLVNWENLADHTVGFRQSPAYQKWKALLHHFYDPFPLVEHYTTIIDQGNLS
ncbi:antibiotic biosynthesis monooxygenase [soil metagenome]